jgi:hypothetical protein
MSDSVLTPFAGRLVSNQVPAEPDGEEDLGAFAILRGVRDFARYLELKKRDGTIVALGYSWLERVELDASGALALHFTNQRVKIIGRNLNSESRPNVRMLDGILRHRVPWIREFSERDALVAEKRSIVVEEITMGT